MDSNPAQLASLYNALQWLVLVDFTNHYVSLVLVYFTNHYVLLTSSNRS